MKGLLTNFPFHKFSIFVTIIVSFTFNVLNDTYVVFTCNDEAHDCYLYMFLPFGSIVFILLLTDKTFLRIFKYTCACTCTRKCSWRCCTTCCSPCCSAKCCGIFVVLLSCILKAALVGLLWVVSVLIDGDWWVCCWRHQSKIKSQLAGRDRNTFTAEERVIITDLKNKSRVFGFLLLLVIISSAFLLTLFGQSKCGRYDRLVYEQKILEEEENVLKTLLKEEANKELMEKMRERINDGKWNECLDVAEELIDAKRTSEGRENDNLLNQGSDRQDETNVDEH